MKRLSTAVKTLDELGYQVISAERQSGGINSLVYKITCSTGAKFALKIYPIQQENNIRDRYEAEKNFLKVINANDVKNTTTIIASHDEQRWCLLGWIEGKKIDKLEGDDIKQIARFIKKLNSDPKNRNKNCKSMASEAHTSLEEIIRNIDIRLGKLKENLRRSDHGEKLNEWITEVIEPVYMEQKKKLLQERKELSHWKDLSNERINSPSDVGIHNMLRAKDGLYFFDFEYAGWDDLSKLVGDWVLQPECIFSNNDALALIDELNEQNVTENKTGWVNRIKDIRELIIIKWVLIILKQNRNKNEQLAKAKKYYEKTRLRPYFP